jgi:hypothetical protein
MLAERWTDQRLPFQRIASGSPLVPIMVQAVAEPHDTLVSVLVPMFGNRWLHHFFPFQRSTSARSLPDPYDPMATQATGDAQDTRLSA